jgi:quercetin dioxygenase-like cupin family protein
MAAQQTFPTLGPRCIVVDTPWGKSVQADEAIAKGTPLYEFPGKIVDKPNMHTVQLSRGRHIDGHTGGPEYTSHACDPNAYFRFGANDYVELVAIKDIVAGDHITFHYCTTEWDMAEKFDCVCGSKLCIGAIKGYRHITPAGAKQLEPYLSPFIRYMRSEQQASDQASSAIWGDAVAPEDGVPAGFKLRTTFPTNPNGVEVMLEQWEAGSSEPPHIHPGDDMTVVVEGLMEVQFYTKLEKDGSSNLVKDGPPLVLKAGETGYVAAGRIHDAKYIQACKLVYVHNKAFGFAAQ